MNVGLISQIRRLRQLPPIGRTITINVNTSGNTLIDGYALPYEGGTTTLQDGDTVIINGGICGGWISFENLNLPNGQHALIRNNGLIDVQNYAIWMGDGASQETTQPLRNVTIDFYNQDGVNEYGMKAKSGGDSGVWATMLMNSWDAPVTWENVVISGVEFDCDWGQSREYIGWSYDGVTYNDGSGVISSKNLHIKNMKFNIQAQMASGLIGFYSGIVGNGTDNNYHEDLKITDIKVLGDGISTVNQVAILANVKNYTVSNIEISNIPTEPLHNRLLKLYGYGVAYNIKAVNYYGNILQLAPFKRDSVVETVNTRVWNIIGYNNSKYSLIEMSGIGNLGLWNKAFVDPVDLQIDFCTAHTIGTANDYFARMLDAFGSAGALIVNSSVIQNANSTTNVTGGGSGVDNYIHPTVNSTSPNIDTTTFEPNTGSPIIDATTYTTPSWAELDINEVSRPSTGANIGAVETVKT